MARPAGNYDAKDVEFSQQLRRDRHMGYNMPWEKFYSSQLIQDAEMKLATAYDRQTMERKKQLIAEREQDYANLFLTLICQMDLNGKTPELRYSLSLVDELLSENEAYISLLRGLEPKSSDALKHVLVTTSDTYSIAKASKILALLLIKSNKPPEEPLHELFVFCADRLRKDVAAENSVALGALQTLLRRDEFRVMFVQKDDGINRIKRLLNPNMQHSQILYQALYCLWLMSYNEDIADTFHTTTIIEKIVQVVRDVPKEKVIRVGVATLRNIANKGKDNLNNAQMMAAGCLRVLENLSMKKWADDDITDDLEFLMESLQQNIVELSSFDKYKQQVDTGELVWSPVHTSDKFWRENIAKFEENDFEIVKQLLNLLKKAKVAQDIIVLQVALHDLGEFVRFHPNGRKKVTDGGGKLIIMDLLEHQDAEVQKQALQCTQKLLTSNWDYLNR